MKKTYGKDAEAVFYASKNKGNISMVDQTKLIWQNKLYENLVEMAKKPSKTKSQYGPRKPLLHTDPKTGLVTTLVRRGDEPEAGMPRGRYTRPPVGPPSRTTEGSTKNGNDAADAARTDPRERTAAQQKAYEEARKKYQETGVTPFRPARGSAMSAEDKLEKAGLGKAPHKSKKKSKKKKKKKKK